MKKLNYNVLSKIYSRICAATLGQVWTPSDFVDLGARTAIDKALQRLVAAGDLRRIDRGLYDRPGTNKLTGKLAAADYRAVIDAIARRDQIRMLVDGMTAANDLGLSDAVPGRVIVHSDARLKPVRLGNLTITFQPTSPSKLYWAGRPAMRIVQALHWLKSTLSDPKDNQRIRRRVETLLSDPKQGGAFRKDLKAGLKLLPTWMQDFLRDTLSAEHNSSANSRRARKRRKVTAT
jgi:hypothetical protein